MDPITLVAEINAALAIEQQIAGWIQQRRAQSGLSDDQVLDAALAKDAETHARIKAFLDKLKAA